MMQMSHRLAIMERKNNCHSIWFYRSLDIFFVPCFIYTHNDLSKGLLKSEAERRFLKVPASGNERS